MLVEDSYDCFKARHKGGKTETETSPENGRSVSVKIVDKKKLRRSKKRAGGFL